MVCSSCGWEVSECWCVGGGEVRGSYQCGGGNGYGRGGSGGGRGSGVFSACRDCLVV